MWLDCVTLSRVRSIELIGGGRSLRTLLMSYPSIVPVWKNVDPNSSLLCEAGVGLYSICTSKSRSSCCFVVGQVSWYVRSWDGVGDDI